MDNPVKPTDGGIIIKLKIIPNSSKNEFIKIDGGVKLKVTAPPVDNKANKFVTEFLAKNFKVPKTSIKIIKGETSKEKTFFLSITNLDKIKQIETFFNCL